MGGWGKDNGSDAIMGYDAMSNEAAARDRLFEVRNVPVGQDVDFFFFSSRRRHTRCSRDWSSDVCSSDLGIENAFRAWLGFRCGCGHELSLLLLKVDASAGKDARLLGDVVANRQFRSVVAQDPLMLAYFLSPRQARGDQ